MVAHLFGAGPRYSLAVRRLALGAGTLRERLKRAYLEAAFAMADDDGEPACSPELQHRIAQLHRRMTQRPSVREEGTVSASINFMSDDEVRAVAEEVLSIAEALEREAAVHLRRSGAVAPPVDAAGYARAEPPAAGDVARTRPASVAG
jgi:hypothetical protein